MIRDSLKSEIWSFSSVVSEATVAIVAIVAIVATVAIVAIVAIVAKCPFNFIVIYFLV